MKRFFLIILSLIFLFSATGCNGETPLFGTGVKEATQFQIGDQLELKTGLSSGVLKVTISDATLISEASELPGKEMFFEQYRRYVSDDGTFVDGSYLIIIDVDIESADAESVLSLDNDNPHMFRIDSLFTLVDVSEKQGQNYRYQTVDYFSLLNNHDAHPFAFELEPEETISFRIGFFMGKKKDGSARSLSNLFLCTSSGNPESDFIALNLEATEDD